MKRNATILIALAALATPLLASDQPALPKGHPVIPGAQQSQADQLPAGHPDMSALLNAKGTVTVRVTRGASSAEAVKDVPVTVELHTPGGILTELKGKTDAAGQIAFPDLSLQSAFQPLLRAEYGGVKYVAPAKVMDVRQPNQQIDLKVYDTTTQRPAFTVAMRHISVEPAGEVIRVTETINIENPGDRAWVGDSRKDGKRQTVSIQLPAKAEQIQVSPLLSDRCELSDANQFILTSALTPGMTSLEFIYFIPVEPNQTKLTFTAPAATRHMMLFAIDSGGAITAEGLKQTAAHQMGKAKAQVFSGGDLTPGQQVSITIAAAAQGNVALPKGHPTVPATARP